MAAIARPDNKNILTLPSIAVVVLAGVQDLAGKIVQCRNIREVRNTADASGEDDVPRVHFTARPAFKWGQSHACSAQFDADRQRRAKRTVALREEQPARSRPQGKAYSRDFRGPNWFDVRQAAVEYTHHDPAVLVVGGGQAGLSAAACLTQLGIDTLVVDREPRIGDNWRKRYHALVLHNQMHVNHLPYMRFPPNWPAYIPKDKIAGWFGAYAESMELNFWTATEFEGGTYDEEAERWSVVVQRADGSKRMSLDLVQSR